MNLPILGCRALVVWLLALSLGACGGGAGTAPPPQGVENNVKTALATPTATAKGFVANGWYWNPAEGGTGFMFESQGDHAFIAFFMYEEGTGKPVWYASGGNTGQFAEMPDGSFLFSGDLLVYHGGQPAWSSVYTPGQPRSVGTVRISFKGTEAVAELPGRTMKATRFDFAGLGSVSNDRQPEVGWYWNPAEGGRGYAIEVQNNRVFMAMFHYNPDGSPTWNVVEADIPDGRASGSFLLYGDGQTLQSAYRGARHWDIGTFAISFRQPCAGQIQLGGAAPVSIRRFVFGNLPPGAECRTMTAATADLVPGLAVGPVRMHPGDVMHGRIDTAGDVDAYGIALKAGSDYTFEVPQALGTLADPALTLYDANLVPIAQARSPNARISYASTTSGPHYLAVRSTGGRETGLFVLTASGSSSDFVALPPANAARYAGSVNLTVTGQGAASVSLSVDETGRIGGTVIWADGKTAALAGEVAGNGSVRASTGASGFVILGQIDPQGRLSATWTRPDGSGGLVVGQSSMAASASAKMTPLPSAPEASRFLQQASFGPTLHDIAELQAASIPAWIDAQLAMPAGSPYLDHIQGKFDSDPKNRPNAAGTTYNSVWNAEAFWRLSVTGRDQLRKRVAFALQQIFVISLVDGTLWEHGRPLAQHLDNLERGAFGNYRALLENVALSPVMGMYLSHIRNQKEDASIGRYPDENFAREVMQLFSIGLYELNLDGSLVRDARGQPVETYGNDDVMAMARVFTGWSWGFDGAQYTDHNFLWATPTPDTTGAARVDVRPMRVYPSYHAPQAKPLFVGKPHAVLIPAGTDGTTSLKMALDALFNHPNVGPFMGRQLIQKLVTSNPSPAFVARVATAFNDNGKGVRGDMAAVVRAILLDPEARGEPGPNFGKLREPVLRETHWLRAFNAVSSTGEYMLAGDMADLLQMVHYAPSVFSYFRPGHVPPNTGLAELGLAAPEFQIADESTAAAWPNRVASWLTIGTGWTGTTTDVRASLAEETALCAVAPGLLLDRIDLLLFAGRMSAALRQNILDALAGVPPGMEQRDLQRTRLAVYLALSSPEYLVQR